MHIFLSAGTSINLSECSPFCALLFASTSNSSNSFILCFFARIRLLRSFLLSFSFSSANLPKRFFIRSVKRGVQSVISFPFRSIFVPICLESSFGCSERGSGTSCVKSWLNLERFLALRSFFAFSFSSAALFSEAEVTGSYGGAGISPTSLILPV